MTDRPIIFSGPMVQALFDGRKTQTRRILKPHSDMARMLSVWMGEVAAFHETDRTSRLRIGRVITDHKLPFSPGDRLWVRETWRTHCDMDHITPRDLPRDAAIQYPATYDGWVSKRRPAIHMPRWASRLTLTVADVRVERLQDITLGDIVQEVGAKSIYDFKPAHDGFRVWQELWNSINGEGSWAENPFVCALTFTVHKANIDHMQAEAA